jgi:biotin carboxylase
MHVLILRRPHSTARYDHWIREADPDARITVLTSADAEQEELDFAPGVELVLVPDYEAPATTAELLRLCEKVVPDRIFVNSEDDVLRAAEARTLFGITGQGSATALRFRDKIRMKRLFDGLPVRVVPFRSVRCVADLLAAQRELGAIVVKPRDGAGSVGVRVLPGERAVRRACVEDGDLLNDLHRGVLMAEQYIEGTVYHVDVLVDGSAAVLVSPSRYTSPPHRFHAENLGSIMLDEGTVRAKLLTDIARRFVANLPEDHGVQVLHLEFFEDAAGVFWAGEVACRIGGALVKNGIRHTYGVDLSRAACLLSAGLWTPPAHLGRSAAATGWLLWTGGPEPSVPPDRPKWLVEHSTIERSQGPASSVDAKARLLVEGVDEQQIEHRFHILSGLRRP